MASSKRRSFARFDSIPDEKSISSVWHSLELKMPDAISHIALSLKTFKENKPDRVFTNFPLMFDKRRYAQIMDDLYFMLAKAKLVDFVDSSGDDTGLKKLSENSKEQVLVWFEKVTNLACDLLLDSRGNLRFDVIRDFNWNADSNSPKIFDTKILINIICAFVSYTMEQCAVMFYTGKEQNNKDTKGEIAFVTINGESKPKLDPDYFSRLGLVYNAYSSQTYKLKEIIIGRLLKQGNFLLTLACEMTSVKDISPEAKNEIQQRLTRYIVNSITVEYLETLPNNVTANSPKNAVSNLIVKEHQALAKLIKDSEQEENYSNVTKFLESFSKFVGEELRLITFRQLIKKYIDLSRCYNETLQTGIPQMSEAIGVKPTRVFQYFSMPEAELKQNVSSSSESSATTPQSESIKKKILSVHARLKKRFSTPEETKLPLSEQKDSSPVQTPSPPSQVSSLPASPAVQPLAIASMPELSPLSISPSQFSIGKN